VLHSSRPTSEHRNSGKQKKYRLPFPLPPASVFYSYTFRKRAFRGLNQSISSAMSNSTLALLVFTLGSITCALSKSTLDDDYAAFRQKHGRQDIDSKQYNQGYSSLHNAVSTSKHRTPSPMHFGEQRSTSLQTTQKKNSGQCLAIRAAAIVLEPLRQSAGHPSCR